MSVLTLVSGKEDRTLRRIRVSEIARNPNQPRKYFDPEAIAQLAESIRQYGVLNPLTVRRAPGGGYELVAGERRLRAARVAGLNDVPCLLIAADNEDSSAIALVENLQRRDLDFFEEAYGFKRLHDDEERMNATHYIIENELNVSRSEEYIENLLEQKKHPELAEPPHKDNVVRLIKDVRFFLNTLNRAVGVMVDAGIGATVDRQENEDGITQRADVSRETLLFHRRADFVSRETFNGRL